MQRLTNQIKDYGWGSRTAIAYVQGRPAPTLEPEAELWLGAHPGGASRLGTGEALDVAIEADPDRLLGSPVVHRFGARLPYLFKVLAAEVPLSIQAHPDEEYARVAYAAEQATGLPPGDPGRNYVDPYHKPELLVAVEPFEALCGFREPAASAAVLESFAVPALEPVLEALRTGERSQRLSVAVQRIMAWPESERAGLVAAVAEAGRDRVGLPGGFADSHGLAADLGKRCPGDLGVVLALLLNHVRLAPDEAVWMPAGNLHAYLRGVGVEIMAASDNVLRGGLTAKRVDVAELLRVVRYEVLDQPVVRPRQVAPGLLEYRPPVAEFGLAKATVGATTPSVALPGRGPRIVLCLSGAVELEHAHERVTLRGGESVFVAAAEPAVMVRGSGVCYQAGVGID